MKGTKLIDPTEKPPLAKWRPPVDDPRFYQHPKPEDLANYHEEPAYICTPACRIYEGRLQLFFKKKKKEKAPVFFFSDARIMEIHLTTTVLMLLIT